MSKTRPMQWKHVASLQIQIKEGSDWAFWVCVNWNTQGVLGKPNVCVSVVKVWEREGNIVKAGQGSGETLLNVWTSPTVNGPNCWQQWAEDVLQRLQVYMWNLWFQLWVHDVQMSLEWYSFQVSGQCFSSQMNQGSVVSPYPPISWTLNASRDQRDVSRRRWRRRTNSQWHFCCGTTSISCCSLRARNPQVC